MLGGMLFVKAGVLTRLNYFGKRSARCFRFDILYQLRTVHADSSAVDTSITYQSTLRTKRYIFCFYFEHDFNIRYIEKILLLKLRFKDI